MLIALSLLFIDLASNAQETPTQQLPRHRCATMELERAIIQQDPGILQRWKAAGELAQEAWRQRKQQSLQLNGPGGVPLSGDGSLVIPVVFHLVGSAAILNNIPDRDVYDQVEILNRDFAGKKAALYNGLFAPELAARLGEVPIKFVLARKTPANAPTSGIERRVSARTFSGGTDGSPVTVFQLKSTASGGLDPWAPSQYLNIWCGSFSDGLLGIATFPYTTSALTGPQGVAIDLYALGSNSCRTYYPGYHEGATLSHEIGHYFYLYHTFGDVNYCNNNDFNIQAGWPLTAAASHDDTPPEKGGSDFIYGNMSGIYSDGCTSTSYGMMYQNFMNYFDDRSLYMFSGGQKERIMATIDMYRPGLLSSTATTPPAPVTDAWLVSMSPLGRCDSRSPVVNNTPLQSRVRNYGTTTLTSVTLNIEFDGGAPVVTSFPLDLAAGRDTILKSGTISGAMGPHTIRAYTSNPNGISDQYPQNDTIQSYINIRTQTITAPFIESFSSSIFPPRLNTVNDYWFINNPQNATWTYNSTAGSAAAGSATVANYNYARNGEQDELITPPIDFGANDSAVLTFAVAHAQKSFSTQDWDGLEVYVSGDGGQHFTLVYKKVSDKLKTVPSDVFSFFNPGTDQEQWRTDTVNLSPFILPGQKMFIKFRNVTAHGNNTYLDDISVKAHTQLPNDIVAVSVQHFPPFVCSTAPLAPSFTFANNGTDPLTAAQVHYKLDNGAVTTIPWTGSLQRGESATLALNTLSGISTGTHTLTIYVTQSNGQPDLQPANDTLHSNINILSTLNSPLREGFEAPAFPPANWFVISSGQAYTWERTTNASSEGSASAWVRNYRYNGHGKPEILYSSPMQAGAVDSLFLEFDLAHATQLFPGQTGMPTDTLEVLLTKDCGQHFQSIYRKWGPALETTGRPDLPLSFDRSTDQVGFVPTSSQWRKERIEITHLVTANNPFQVFFKNTSNRDNNTFLDNIKVVPIILPARLKANGYMIAPNPFNGQFEIRHLQAPADLQRILITNAAGQVVYSRTFNGNASSYMRIDLGSCSDGLYIVQLTYDKKVITQKLVKAK